MSAPLRKWVHVGVKTVPQTEQLFYAVCARLRKNSGAFPQVGADFTKQRKEQEQQEEEEEMKQGRRQGEEGYGWSGREKEEEKRKGGEGGGEGRWSM